MNHMNSCYATPHLSLCICCSRIGILVHGVHTVWLFLLVLKVCIMLPCGQTIFKSLRVVGMWYPLMFMINIIAIVQFVNHIITILFDIMPATTRTSWCPSQLVDEIGRIVPLADEFGENKMHNWIKQPWTRNLMIHRHMVKQISMTISQTQALLKCW